MFGFMRKQSGVPQKGFSKKLKRGAVITSVTIAVCGAVSLFVPFVPLIVAVAVGGVAGGAIANATGEEVKK